MSNMARELASGFTPGINEFHNFVFPDLTSESGAIELVAKEFASDNLQDFIQRFERDASGSRVMPLDEETWAKLENTDSYQVAKNEWSKVREHTFKSGKGNDWQGIRTRINVGSGVDAPIILKTRDKLHLISGNTRLMVCRAMGVTPGVLIVDMSVTG